MDEASFVLQAIRDELDKQSAEAVRPLVLGDESLSVSQGNARLRAVVHRDPGAHPAMAHCHVITEIGTHDAPLEACVVGIDPDRQRGLADAARSWVVAVAGPVFSLLQAQSVLEAGHFEGSEPWGVSGCHGFIGPLCARLFDKPYDLQQLRNAPLFDYAAELAPPGIVHLAKTTLTAKGDGCWNRHLEIDAHQASHEDDPWCPSIAAPRQGIVTVFAAFHYGGDSDHVQARQRVDEAIRRFVGAWQKTRDSERSADMLTAEGFDAELVHRVVSFVPLAFGRLVFRSSGVSFAPDFVRVRRDGAIEEGLKLMHQPVFARSMALSSQLFAGEFVEAARQIILTSSEVNALNNALHAGSKLENLRLLPPVIPDFDASQDTVEQAIRQLQERAKAEFNKARPWWQFWRSRKR